MLIIIRDHDEPSVNGRWFDIKEPPSYLPPEPPPVPVGKSYWPSEPPAYERREDGMCARVYRPIKERGDA